MAFGYHHRLILSFVYPLHIINRCAQSHVKYYRNILQLEKSRAIYTHPRLYVHIMYGLSSIKMQFISLGRH